MIIIIIITKFRILLLLLLLLSSSSTLKLSSIIDFSCHGPSSSSAVPVRTPYSHQSTQSTAHPPVPVCDYVMAVQLVQMLSVQKSESQNVRTSFQKCPIPTKGKSPRYWCPELNSEGQRNTALSYP